jgi:hypothetical protein
MLLGFAMFAAFTLFTNLVQTPKAQFGYGLSGSVLDVGLYLLPATVGMLIFSALAGRFERKLGAAYTLAIGSLFVAASLVWLAVSNSHVYDVVASSALQGVGFGIGYAARWAPKWARYRHPNKPKHWVVGRYFGAFNKFRNDRWVFGDRDSGGHLVKFAWTSINRHVMVKGAASTDDPALADYWASRRRRSKPPLDSYTLGLLTRQDGHCPLCGATCSPPTSRRSPRSSGNDGGSRSPARR